MAYDPSLPTLSQAMGRTPQVAERPGLGTLFGAAAQGAYGAARYGTPALVERVAGTMTPEDERYYAAWNNYWQDRARQTAPTGPAGLEDITSGRVGLGRAFVENLAYSVPYAAGALAGGAIGTLAAPGPGTLAGAAGALAGGAAQFAGTNASRALEETGGLSSSQAARSLAVAPVQSGLELAGARFIPGLGRFLGPLAAKFEGNIASRAAKSAVAGAITEATTEVGQQAAERFAAGLPLDDRAAMQEFVQAFAIGGLVGGGLGGMSGAFRRKAQAANPAEITDDELALTVDDELKLLPAPQPLDLRWSQAMPTEGEVYGPQRPGMFTDAAGRTAEGEQGFNDLLATPRRPDPGTTLFNMPPTPLPTRGPTFEFGLPEGATEQPLQPLTPRFEDLPVGFEPDMFNPAPMEAAVKNVPTKQLQEIAKKARRKNSGVAPEVAAAVEQELGNRSKGGAPVAAATGPFDGIRMNQDLKKLQGANEEELVAGVRKLLEGGDARKGTLDLAERLGILNEPAAEGQVAAEPGSQPDVATQPEDFGTFARRTEDERAAVYSLMSADQQEQLKLETYEALGRAMPEGLSERQTELLNTRFEKVGRELGLIDDNGLTEEGRRIARKAPAPTEEVIQAAQAQGLSGTAVAAFERGAQGVEQTQFDSLTDAAAYLAGQRWKVPQTSTADQTRATTYTDRATGLTDGGRTRSRSMTGRVESLNPEQERQQSLFLAIEQGGYAEQARLKRMVVEGATDQELDDAARYLQRGGSLSPDPAPTRSQGPILENGQVRYTEGVKFSEQERARRRIRREQLEAEQAEASQQALLNRGSKSKQRAEVKRLLSEEIEAAYKSEDIDGVTRLRLIDKLRKGDYKGVQRGLPGGENLRAAVANAYVGSSVDELNEFHELLSGKDFDNALDVLRRKAPNAQQRKLVEGISKSIAELRRLGMKFDFEVLKLGQELPRGMHEGMRGAAYINKNKISIRLQPRLAVHAGTDYETLVHEMAHAATVAATQLARTSTEFAKTRPGRAVQAIEEVYEQAMAHLRTKFEAGQLTQFERDMLTGESNTLENIDELIAWGNTNPEFQAWLDGIYVSKDKTLWQKLVEAIASLFGIGPKQVSALEEVLRLSEQVMDARAVDYMMSGDPDLRENTAAHVAPRARSVLQSNETLKSAIKTVVGAGDALAARENASGLYRMSLGWQSMDHLVERWGQKLNGLADLQRIDGERHATMTKMAQQLVGWHQQVQQASDADTKRLNSLMRMTRYGADPRKRWEDQAWLHDLPNANLIREDLTKAAQDYNTLKRQGKASLYDDAVALNEMMLYAELASRTHSLVAFDPELATALKVGEDPAKAFRENIELAETPARARDYWKSELDRRVNLIQTYVNAQRGTMGTLSKREAERLDNRISPTESHLALLKTTLENAGKAPYFHLGRHGDQMISFKAKNLKGVADRGAVRQIAKAFDDAGLDVFIDPNNPRASMFMRFETQDQRLIAERVVKDLKAKNLIDGDIEAGPRPGSGIGQLQGGKRQWFENMLEQLKASLEADLEGASPDEKKEARTQNAKMVAELQNMWLNTVSDNSLVKVMVRRKGTSGEDADMVRSFATRGQMSAVGLANINAAPQIRDAISKMRASVNDARKLDSPNHGSVQGMHDVLQEVVLRQNQRAFIEQTNISDKARAFTNAYFLGLSPAYVFTQLTQLPVLLLPELGKRHGFSKSFGAIAKATPVALRIIKAAAAAAAKPGLTHIGDMAITPQVLKSAGLSPAQEKFVSKMIASGTIDIGSQARELGWISEGTIDSKERLLRMAQSFGLYSETATRLIAALAAADLHDETSGVPKEDYAQHVVRQAMFNYAASSTARQMGKQGFAGQLTPIMMQFMQYSAQLIQKLYREFDAAFLANVSEQERKEARRFLAGHLVAVGTLAGSLGLPMASAIAFAIEKLVDMFDDDEEPFDASAAWGNFLTDVFGDGVGDVLRRGAPRALGFDISERVGEQNIIPFTEFWADRRAIKDKASDQALRSFGAPLSMGVNTLSGLERMMDGDWIGGAIDASPIFLKNIAKAGQMGASGEYIDGRGNRLQLSPGAADIMYQLLGFTPAEKAEDTERRTDQFNRRTVLNGRAARLRNRIVNAILEGGDPASAIREAREFDLENPEYAVLPDIESTVARRLRNEAIATSTGMPIGVRATDLGARELTRY